MLQLPCDMYASTDRKKSVQRKIHAFGFEIKTQGCELI